jgi:glutamate-1-semialdehyde 2,1-aminomutase
MPVSGMGQRAQSQRLYERAQGLLPGGVNSPVRAFGAVGGTPVFFDSARGSTARDADGREYVDFCQSWGPLILGHAAPAVVAAVQRAAERGLSFGACHAAEADLAELIVAGYDGAERVRLVSSGTEAVMTALRIARGATGRPLIVKFEGGYHGHHDSLLVNAGSGLATTGLASSAGVPDVIAGATVVARLDDEESVSAVFAAHGDAIAAVIVEPVPANNGLLLQRDAFLDHLAGEARRAGALLIADEVIAGFRLRYGASAAAERLQPDLVTLGKIIGGGMPIGAVTGRAELLEHLAPVGSVYQAGTLSGNPLSVAAGIATLDALTDRGRYVELERLGAAVEEVVRSAALPGLQLIRSGSMLWPYYGTDRPRAAHQIDDTAIARFNGAYGSFLERGLYLPPSGYEVSFLSTAHTAVECRALADALLAAAD